MLPKRGTNQGEYPSEAASPTRNPSLKTQEQIAKQGRPDLPSDGVGTMAKKVGQFEGLFDLFEKDLDCPAGTIEVGHAAGTPIHIVGKEFHLALNAIHFNERAHPDV